MLQFWSRLAWKYILISAHEISYWFQHFNQNKKMGICFKKVYYGNVKCVVQSTVQYLIKSYFKRLSCLAYRTLAFLLFNWLFFRVLRVWDQVMHICKLMNEVIRIVSVKIQCCNALGGTTVHKFNVKMLFLIFITFGVDRIFVLVQNFLYWQG